MSEIQKCSKCKSEKHLKYFSVNKKGQLYRTCDGCRIKRTDTNFVDGFNDNNKTLVELINALTTITTQLQKLIKEQPQSEVESTTAESSPETENTLL